MAGVINLHVTEPPASNFLYVGREYGGFKESIFHNPYVISGQLNRQDVLDKYELHIKNRADLYARLPLIKNKILGCWCSPQPCHAHILIRLYQEHLKGLATASMHDF